MKKFIFIPLLLLGFAQAQLKISQFPIYLPKADSALIPVVINNTNRTMFAIDIAKSVKIDLLLNTNYLDVDATDTSLILANSGVASGTYTSITSITVDAKGRVTAINGTLTGGGSNAPPVASAVSISGTATQGQTLIGSHSYSDADGDAQGTSTRQWYRSDNTSALNRTAISGATGTTYVLQAADVGKYIQYAVTPVATAGTTPGTQVFSAYTAQVAASGGGGGTTDLTIAQQQSGGDIAETSTGSKIYASTAGAYARFTQYIPAGQDGLVYWEVGTNSQQVYIGLDGTNTLEDWFTSVHNWDYYFYFNVDVLFRGVAGSANATYDNPVINIGAAGQMYGIGRRGTSMVIQHSTNSGSTWTTVYTFPGTAPTGNLYGKLKLVGGTQITHPKGEGVQ